MPKVFRMYGSGNGNIVDGQVHVFVIFSWSRSENGGTAFVRI